VDVHRRRVVRSFLPVREEGDLPFAHPRRSQPDDRLVRATPVGVVQPAFGARLDVDDEQIGPHGVEPTLSIELVLEALGLDRGPLLASRPEVLALLVGRVPGRDDESLAVRSPVESPHSFLAVGDLAGITT